MAVGMLLQGAFLPQLCMPFFRSRMQMALAMHNEAAWIEDMHGHNHGMVALLRNKLHVPLCRCAHERMSFASTCTIGQFQHRDSFLQTRQHICCSSSFN